MIIKTILSAIILGIAATGCSSSSIHQILSHGEKPSENIVTASYDFSDIRGIDTSCGIIVHCSQKAAAEPVRIKGPENVMEALEITLSKKGALHLRLKNGSNFRYRSDEEHINVWVAAPAISKFDASSGGSIHAGGTITLSAPVDIETSSGAHIYFSDLQVAEASLEASSGSMIKIQSLTSKKVEADASSGAHIAINGGTSANADFDASSGGSINASGMDAQTGSCSASSGARIKSSIRNAKTDKSSGGSISNTSGK